MLCLCFGLLYGFVKDGTLVPPVTGGTCYLDCTKPIQLLGRAASSVGVMYRSSGPNTWSNPRESADTKKKKEISNNAMNESIKASSCP